MELSNLRIAIYVFIALSTISIILYTHFKLIQLKRDAYRKCLDAIAMTMTQARQTARDTTTQGKADAYMMKNTDLHALNYYTQLRIKTSKRLEAEAWDRFLTSKKVELNLYEAVPDEDQRRRLLHFLSLDTPSKEYILYRTEWNFNPSYNNWREHGKDY
ncbi:hypothetical protein M1M30_gp149 [Maribacter phage Colly_1]|uniref:Uncharacterized protein n=1 Tax=Maribacter phage Colly_1 TaxID=2745691 RepID=A0A8E4UXV9_9CAUD|nr:hypothetical protein M1M30_gp149 [Maribacter phage Colly_1]QQO97250.1 hypothetical protein Colly1_149 [Maribacter phage Colly_1]